MTDDAVNGAGLCFRDMAVTGAELSEDDSDWTPDGFALIDNKVNQDYIVQIIQMSSNNQVTAVALDENNTGEIVVSSPQALERLIVAVASLAPLTLQPAPYTLTVEPAN